jgi:hypothetical protein
MNVPQLALTVLPSVAILRNLTERHELNSAWTILSKENAVRLSMATEGSRQGVSEQLCVCVCVCVPWNGRNVLILKHSTPYLLVTSHFCLFQLNGHKILQYISPITCYMLRCLLHHLQGDHCVTSWNSVRFLQCCNTDCAVKCTICHVFFNLQFSYNV